MQATRRLFLLVLAFGFAVSASFVAAQVVTATLPVGQYPQGAALNSLSNKIYIINQCGNDPSCASVGTVTVIDGATLNTQTVNVGYEPDGIAVNSTTNKIYVSNVCGNDPTCASTGTVTVIDGVTNNTETVSVGYGPQTGLAVNPVTNKVYVVSYYYPDYLVTVIDGATLNTQTVSAGNNPQGIAVNSATNTIYVMNQCAPYPCSNGSVTVIDGATLNTQAVNVGYGPLGITVNSVTNKIYVANQCANPNNCNLGGTVTVIDGATLNTQTVDVGIDPLGVVVNSSINKIYVPDQCADDNCYTGDVTVIDGATNNTTTIGGLPGSFCCSSPPGGGITLDSVTNKVYLREYSSIAVIDGTTSTIKTLGVGGTGYRYYNGGPLVAVNEATNRIYVPNGGDGTLSVIAGDTTLQFIPATPCRVVDTRNPNGTFGGPAIQGGAHRDFPLSLGGCNIPPNAVAYSLNVTVVPSGLLGYLTIWPASEFQPYSSTMNSVDGRVKANAAIVQGGVNTAVSVYVSNTTNVVLDINGYFAPATSSTLAFFPLAPCRVADTRKPLGRLGGPILTGGEERDFPILDATSCGIPDSAQAYSFNFTAIPHGTLGYLSVWPAGQSRPLVSTLNAPTGTVVANAAIVPAGTGGEVAVYPSNDTDLVIDINGYFAAANSGPNPLSLYPLQSCRALDTRYGQGGWFSGELVLDVFGSYCGVSNQAQAYVFNATVIPRVWLGYLTLWPDGESQPVVSTLNAVDGAITSNMAIVVTTNGLLDAYTSNLTQLIMDISGYFAP